MGGSVGKVLYSGYDTATALVGSSQLIKTYTSSTQPDYGIWDQTGMYTRPYSLLES